MNKIIRNWSKKLAATFMSAVIALGMCGCADKASTATLDDVEIWGAPGTEKVLSDVSGIYDSFKTDAKIDLLTARGEYEGAQIILSAQKDVTYDVSVGEVKAADGTVFPGKVEVFGEKYVEVRINYDQNGAPTGHYPDALVPFDGLKKQGENTVKAGENQGLYFRFNVPVDCKPDVYTGTAAVTIGGQSRTIPVRIRVTEAVVSPETHSKSIFLTTWSHHLGELDSTDAMLDKYIEALFEYRLSPNDIIRDSDSSDEDIDYWVEKAYRFMQNPKCTNISVPYLQVSKYNEAADEYMYIADPVQFERYVTAMADKSFATGYNMLKKAVCYFATFLDEPTPDYAPNVIFALDAYYAMLNDIADKIAAQDTPNATGMDDTKFAKFKSEVVQSIRDIRNVLTASYDEALDGHVQTFCPQVQCYNTEKERAVYGEQVERWWYTCIYPRAPYPTYHTEDTLLSARALGWMQARYDVTGQLYWATDVYAFSYNSADNIQFIEDIYEGGASRYPAVNGDGYLFYPGKKYGVDGPIGSLRLEAIRDGLEEYELIYALKSKYAEIGAACGQNFDCDKAIDDITREVYNGTIVSTDSDKFASAREALLNLSVMSESDAKFCIADRVDDGYGTVTYTVYADAAASVQNLGADAAEKRAAGDGYLYTFPIKLDKQSNSAQFTVMVGGKTFNYAIGLGGSVSVNSGELFAADDFAEEGVAPEFASVAANTVDSSFADGTWAKLTLPQTQAETYQSFRAAGAVMRGINKTTGKVLMHVYYNGDDAPELSISAKHAKDEVYIGMNTVTLAKGMNTIELSFMGKNWNRLGNLQFLSFTVGSNGGEQARELYIVDTVVYAN